MEYETIAAPARTELEISRSRFLTRLERVESEAHAREVIAEARAEHPKARHHCSAFVLEPDQRIKRSNDDGEPSGTAGAPMLDALVSAGLSDVVAVVTRYFGGVLLGAGGLTRAYRAAVAEAVEQTARVTKALRVGVAIRTPYDVAAMLQAEARRREWVVGDAEYSDSVLSKLMLPEGELSACAALAAELSAGEAEVRIGEAQFIDLDAPRK